MEERIKVEWMKLSQNPAAMALYAGVGRERSHALVSIASDVGPVFSGVCNLSKDCKHLIAPDIVVDALEERREARREKRASPFDPEVQRAQVHIQAQVPTRSAEITDGFSKMLGCFNDKKTYAASTFCPQRIWTASRKPLT